MDGGGGGGGGGGEERGGKGEVRALVKGEREKGSTCECLFCILSNNSYTLSKWKWDRRACLYSEGGYLQPLKDHTIQNKCKKQLKK